MTVEVVVVDVVEAEAYDGQIDLQIEEGHEDPVWLRWWRTDVAESAYLCSSGVEVDDRSFLCDLRESHQGPSHVAHDTQEEGLVLRRWPLTQDELDVLVPEGL